MQFTPKPYKPRQIIMKQTIQITRIRLKHMQQNGNHETNMN